MRCLDLRRLKRPETDSIKAVKKKNSVILCSCLAPFLVVSGHCCCRNIHLDKSYCLRKSTFRVGWNVSRDIWQLKPWEKAPTTVQQNNTSVEASRIHPQEDNTKPSLRRDLRKDNTHIKHWKLNEGNFLGFFCAKCWANRRLRTGDASCHQWAKEPRSATFTCQSSTAALLCRETFNTRDWGCSLTDPPNETLTHFAFLFSVDTTCCPEVTSYSCVFVSRAAESLVSLNYRYKHKCFLEGKKGTNYCNVHLWQEICMFCVSFYGSVFVAQIV